MIQTAAGRVAIARHAASGPQIVRRLGWAMAAVASALVVASRLLLARDPYTLLSRPGPPAWLWLIGEAVCPLAGVVTISVLGAVVVARRPGNVLGWVFGGTALVAALTLFAQEYAVYGLVSAPGSLPAAVEAAWTQTWTYHLLLLGVVVGLLLFPDGTLPNWPARGLALLASAVTALQILDSLASSQLLGTTVREESYQLPVTMPPALWNLGSFFALWTDIPTFWAQALLLPLAAASLIARLWWANDEQRRQLMWVALAGAIAAIGWLLSYADQLPHPGLEVSPVEMVDSWGDLVWMFAITVAVPATVGLAVLRYRLYGIDQVINRTVLVAGLVAFIAGIYGLVVGGVGSVVHNSFGPLLGMAAAAVAAVGFAPIRSRLQAFANRLVYGQRATPYEVLADFAERLGAASAEEDVLALMAKLVCRGIGVERAEVWLHVGSQLRLAAAWPVPARGVVTLPLVRETLPTDVGDGGVRLVRDRGELLGAVRIIKRYGERVAPNERRLLDDLARQAALVMRTRRLIEELRASRKRIVGAHDDVRRRLERDLHDGAQQRLVSASVALAIVGEQLAEGGVQAARSSLADAADQLKQGLAELRDLARGIHPAVLTDYGLAAAIESLAQRSALRVELALSLDRRLPAAVETSAYYFVGEGLTNAARHARASIVLVSAVEAHGMLLIEIRDDGVGGADRERGSGLRGLEDRLAALGGRLQVESPPLGGTRLSAELPCG